MEVVPYLLFEDGTRMFDHNRRKGDFENYLLSLENNFEVADDPTVCGPLEVTWAGNLGASLKAWGADTDSCVLPGRGLIEPVPLAPTRLQGLPCALLSVEAMVPGLTDRGGDPARLVAEAEWSVDGGPLRRSSLAYADESDGRFVYVWDLAREPFP